MRPLNTSAPLVLSKARAPVTALAVVLAVVLALLPARVPLPQYFYACGYECPCHFSPSYYSPLPLPLLTLALPHLPLALYSYASDHVFSYFW